MTGPFVPVSTRQRRPRVSAAAVLCVLVWAGLSPAPRAASRPAVRGMQGMVVSPERLATEVGVEVLQRDGNAVDAAVAVALALTVTYPLAAPVGGGGFLLYRQDAERHHALDFRETAPAGIQPDMFLDEEGRPIPGAGLEGGLAVGVPGTVAGLAEAHRRWGSRPWSELVRPAVRLARRGIDVDAFLDTALRVAGDKLLDDPAARTIFAPEGRLLGLGERLVQRDLARTLRGIAVEGADGFHRGRVAEAVASAVREAGGVLQADDIAGYAPVLRPPVEGSYRGYRVVSFPPPSSGGVALLQMLHMLESFALAEAGPGSSRAVHWMAEVERRAYADRSRWLGDPDFFDVPLARLLQEDYLIRRGSSIRDDRATPSRSVLPGDPAAATAGRGAGETLHVSIGDAQGRAVSMTLTLNSWFGTGIVAPGTGVLLNNEMDDFALAPGAPNAYGLIGGEANAVAGGKRPLSSMTPTIVELPEAGPRPALVLGSPGGSTIITSVLQVLLNVVDHGMPLQEAVDAPRVHHQWQPDELRHETRALVADVARALTARGHRLVETRRALGSVNAVGLDADGAWLGAADPRRSASAAGF